MKKFIYQNGPFDPYIFKEKNTYSPQIFLKPFASTNKNYGN